MTDEAIVDARGMRCPWPVVRLARAMRQMEVGGAVRILADDPIARGEITVLAAERGWTLDPGPGEAPVDLRVTVQRSSHAAE